MTSGRVSDASSKQSKTASSPTRAAFKAYKVAILRPAMVSLSEHFIAPIATLIARYVGISTTREEHFARIADTGCITYEHSFTHNAYIKITFALGSWDEAEFCFEYIECGTSQSKTYRHGDPHVQSVASARAMFDVHQAFASRLIVAGSWSRICDHCDLWNTPCRCARVYFKRHVDKIVASLMCKYNELADDFTRGELIELGYEHEPKTTERADAARPGEWVIPEVGDHERAYVDLSRCLETRPCSHSVRFTTGSGFYMSRDSIQQMFVQRGLDPHAHFA